MQSLDYRGKTMPDLGRAWINAYDSMAPGEEAEVRCDQFGAGLRIMLIEGGVHHAAERQEDDTWRIRFRRAPTSSLISNPGAHHAVVDADGNLWTSERRDLVARIDTDARTLAEAASVTRNAAHLAISADGRRLFVADAGADELVVLDSASLSVEYRFPAPGGPQLPFVTEDGKACVTGGATSTLTVVRPNGTGLRADTIGIGSTPHDLCTSPDGRFAFVGCTGDGTVSKVDLEDLREVARFPSGDGPGHLATHPDGDRIYCANTFDGTLTCLSVDGDVLAKADSGRAAHQPKLTPDGTHVWVLNFEDDTIAVFDAETLERVNTLATEAYPHDIEFSRDGRYALAPGYSSEYARIYDIASQTELHRVRLGFACGHAAFVPGTHDVFVPCGDENDVACVSAETGNVTDRVPVRGAATDA